MKNLLISRRDATPLIIVVPGQVHVENIELIILEVFVDEQKIKVVNMLGVVPLSYLKVDKVRGRNKLMRLRSLGTGRRAPQSY